MRSVTCSAWGNKPKAGKPWPAGGKNKQPAALKADRHRHSKGEEARTDRRRETNLCERCSCSDRDQRGESTALVSHARILKCSVKNTHIDFNFTSMKTTCRLIVSKRRHRFGEYKPFIGYMYKKKKIHSMSLIFNLSASKTTITVQQSQNYSTVSSQKGYRE